MTLNHRSKKMIAAFTLAVAAPFMGASSANAAGEPIKDFILRLHHDLYTSTYNGFAHKFNSIIDINKQAQQSKNPAAIAVTQAALDEAVTLANACRATIAESNQAFETLNQRERPLAKPEEVKKLQAILAPFYRNCPKAILPNVQITASGKVVSDVTVSIAALDKDRLATIKKFGAYKSEMLDYYERTVKIGNEISMNIARSDYYDIKGKYELCLTANTNYLNALNQRNVANIRVQKENFEARCVLR